MTWPAIEHDESYADTPWQVIGPDRTVAAAFADRVLADAAAGVLPGARVRHYRTLTLAKLRAQEAGYRASCRQAGCRPDPAMGELLEQIEGLELEPHELHTVAWFAGWDATGDIASIVRKARAAGPAAATPVKSRLRPGPKPAARQLAGEEEEGA